jgi:redox-sensitive bicupin YhaK (pirin superfamily)
MASDYGQPFQIEIGIKSRLSLNERFEYGVLVVHGEIQINANTVPLGNLHYLPAPKARLAIHSSSGAKVLLLGGVPFDEKILMWWNFIGRTHEEIAEMRADWQSQSKRFASFKDRIGGRIPAPKLPN